MNDKKSWFLLLIIIIVVAAAGLILSRFQDNAPTNETETAVVDDSASEYQAVFLDNNQVYFGKLANATRQYVTLSEIFYLQVGQTIQPIDGNASANPDINLVKLGGELHGPTDEMRINRDHIILIEDLRENSNLVTSIKNYLESQSDEN